MTRTAGALVSLMLVASLSSGAEPASKARISTILKRAVAVAKMWQANEVTTSNFLTSSATIARPRGAASPFNVPLDFTGVLAVSSIPVDTGAGQVAACVNCTTEPMPGPNLAMTFPVGLLNRNGVGTTHMTFQTQKASGNCQVAFLWFDPGLGQNIQGALSDPIACSATPGSITVTVFSFINYGVPPVPPGNKILVGVLLHDDGTVRVDYEQFAIQ